MSFKANNILSVLGAVVATYTSLRLLDLLWLYGLRRSSLPRYLHGSHREAPEKQAWALITGASDGIGLGFAAELCARGFNVILHGRNADKLAGIRKDLQQRYPKAHIRLAVLNAKDFTDESMDLMLKEFTGLHITVLINNVGGSPSARPTFRPLQTIDTEMIDEYIGMNARFPTVLTTKLLPQLCKDGPALIVNVGSFAGMLPSAYLSVYSGCKGFNAMWGRSLDYEMRAEGKNVEVLNLWVGSVQNQWDRSATNIFRPSARQFAKRSLDMVGCGRNSVTPHPGHALQAGFVNALPEFVNLWLLPGWAKSLMEKEVEGLNKEK